MNWTPLWYIGLRLSYYSSNITGYQSAGMIQHTQQIESCKHTNKIPRCVYNLNCITSLPPPCFSYIPLCRYVSIGSDSLSPIEY